MRPTDGTKKKKKTIKYEYEIPHHYTRNTYQPIAPTRLVVIFQETARNHFWEAGMLMQSYMLETVQ